MYSCVSSFRLCHVYIQLDVGSCQFDCRQLVPGSREYMYGENAKEARGSKVMQRGASTHFYNMVQ